MRTKLTPTVYILTWCGWEERLHGSTLVFDSLRTGFPTSKIVVVDNCSIPTVRPTLQSLAYSVGATYLQLDSPVPHSDWIAQVIASHPSGPIVLLDPDVVFWESMEDQFPVEGLAGRHIPEFHCPYTRCLVAQRLHTSLVMITEVECLRSALAEVLSKYPITLPFTQTTWKINGVWHSFDTFGQLWELLPESQHKFTSMQLDKYDHLFCGSHMQFVAPRCTPEVQSQLAEWDSAAKNNPKELRGIWRQQEQVFRALAASK